MKLRKICMVGSFAVGKTSLVARYVQGVFSTRYLTTVGVKVDEKRLSVDGDDLTLVLWDLAGEDELNGLNVSYLRGMAGYFLVADGTRKETLHRAGELHAKLSRLHPETPFMLLVNKADLELSWQVGAGDIESLIERGWTVRKVSARDGTGVEDAFQELARRMMHEFPAG